MYLVSSGPGSPPPTGSADAPAARKVASRADGPILIIGDDELFGTAVMTALRHERYDVRQLSATDHDRVLREARRSPRGVAVLDMRLTRGDHGAAIDGFGLLMPLLEAGWTVLVLGGDPDDEARTAVAVTSGAAGVLTRSSSLGAMLRSIKAAAEGECVMTGAQLREWMARYRDYRRTAYELAALFDISA